MAQLDPRDLYTIETPLEQPPDGLVLVHALDGFVDAGRAVEQTRLSLLEATDDKAVAVRFDVDQLHDYRARRPLMRYERDHWASVDLPELVIWKLHDEVGTPYLLLAGPEPDTQWQRFLAAMTLLVGDLGARLTVGLNAFPLGVPHTRPTHVVVHATDRELLGGYEPWMGDVLVPGAMSNLLEHHLGNQGLPALGLAATVPQYVAQTAYPAAAVALLEQLETFAGLKLSTSALSEAARVTAQRIDEQVREAPEVAALVSGLEQGYDAAVNQREQGLSIERLPSADELGAEFERFLAEQDGKDEQG